MEAKTAQLIGAAHATIMRAAAQLGAVLNTEPPRTGDAERRVSDDAEDINTVVASKQQNYDAIVQMMQVKMAQIQERRSELQRQQDRSG